MKFTVYAFALITTLTLVPTSVHAQAAPSTAAPGPSPWSLEASIGWDNSISGDFLSAGIGTFGGRPIAIDQQGWDDVFGTGVLFNATVGYALGEFAEVRGGFTWQSTGTNENQVIGTLGGQPLTVNFDDYKAWALDVGYRQYFAERVERWRPYVGGTLGFGQLEDIDADFAAGSVVATDTLFYEGNGTLVLGLNGGVLYRLTDRLALDGRLGLRYTSGLSDVNDALFTGLDDVNDGSSRWTLPLTVGVRVQF